MKKGWEYGILEDAVEKASSNLSINKLKEEDGDYPLFGASGFVKNLSFYHREEEYLSLVKDGAGVGRVERKPAKSSIVGTLQYIIPKDDFHIDFIYYFLLSIDFKKYFKGSTIPHVYFKDYKNEPFPLIDFDEQERIVAKMDAAFAALDQAKANVEQNLQNAKELFQSKLNEVFSQKGDGWVEKKLGELISVKHGFAFKSIFFEPNGDYVLLTPGNYFEEGGYKDRGGKQKYYIGEIPDGFILQTGDLLVAMTEQAPGLLGSPLLVPEHGKFLHNQRLGLVSINEDLELSNEFLFHLFNTKHLRDEVFDSGTGLKVRHTSPTKIGDVLVHINFDQNVQSEVVDLLNGIKENSVKLMNHYTQKLTELEDLKKSLLERAFKGEI